MVHPGAERSAAPLWVGRASSPMVRQQHKMRTAQTIRNAALAEGSRASHGAPEDGPYPSAGRAKLRKANRNRQIGRPAQSIRRSWRQPTSRMEARMVRIYVRRTVGFSLFVAIVVF